MRGPTVAVAVAIPLHRVQTIEELPTWAVPTFDRAGTEQAAAVPRPGRARPATSQCLHPVASASTACGRLSRTRVRDSCPAPAGLGGVASGVLPSRSPTSLLLSPPQVFLICLNRARQMQHLTPQQLPRGGVWSATSSSSLRQLEAYCLKPLSTPDGMAAAAAADGAAGSASISNAAAAAIGGDGSRSSSTAASSSGKRRAGNSAAVSGTVGPGRNAAGGGAAASGAAEAAYDEDGLR